jgi:hypothetical protein
MPRVKYFNRKRKNIGKQSVADEIIDDSGISNKRVCSTPDNSDNSVPVSRSSESSVSKNKLIQFLPQYDRYNNSEFVYDIVDIHSLLQIISEISVCKICHGKLTFFEDQRNGLQCSVKIMCTSTSCNSNVTYNNSENINVKGNKLDSINTRLVYAFRSIGKGEYAAKTFNAVMNLHAPPRFTRYNKAICSSAEEVCNKSMKDAVEEAVTQNDGCRDIAAAFDGSWQKRGYKSMNGVTSAINITTGKVIDFCALSKYCRCKKKLEGTHDDSCTANYVGTSGGMERHGALQMFQRSQDKYDVRYKQYLGDGDSNAFKSVVEAQPYGCNFEIEKLECVGHVQKRMGTRLRTYKLKNSKKKLPDGKTLGGRGRLTNAMINEIQIYYGLAIRRNTKSIDDMKKAIWATYFHLGSTNDNPQHALCDITWCKYLKAVASGEQYDHSQHTHLSAEILINIKHIFQDLANPLLLKQCLHGGTQNASESLNNIIWNRIPKNIFVSKNSLDLGIYEAVCSYNMGNITKCFILETLGLCPGINCITALKSFDKERIRRAESAIDEIKKKCRQSTQQARQRLEDEYEHEEDAENPSYSAGGH